MLAILQYLGWGFPRASVPRVTEMQFFRRAFPPGIGAGFWCEYTMVPRQRARCSLWLWWWIGVVDDHLCTIEIGPFMASWIEKRYLKLETQPLYWCRYYTLVCMVWICWENRPYAVLVPIPLRLLLQSYIWAFWEPKIEQKIDEDLEWTILMLLASVGWLNLRYMNQKILNLHLALK